MTPKPEKYITMEELSEATGISRPTLYHHVKRSRLKIRKVGFFTVVSEKDAAEFKSHLRKLTMKGRTIIAYQ